MKEARVAQPGPAGLGAEVRHRLPAVWVTCVFGRGRTTCLPSWGLARQDAVCTAGDSSEGEAGSSCDPATSSLAFTHEKSGHPGTPRLEHERSPQPHSRDLKVETMKTSTDGGTDAHTRVCPHDGRRLGHLLWCG